MYNLLLFGKNIKNKYLGKLTSYGTSVVGFLSLPSARLSAVGSSVSSLIGSTTVIPAAPTNLTAPSISGSTYVGAVLTSSTGTWTGSPTSYSYQWKRSGSNISGETNSTYTQTSSDRGLDITCAVTATNISGSSSPSTSAASRTDIHNFTNQTLDGATLTRAATSDTGFYFDASGDIQSVGADTPRYDYDPDTLDYLGLLVEVARGNYARETGGVGYTGATLTYAASGDWSSSVKIVPKTNSSNYNHRMSNSCAPLSVGNTYAVRAFMEYAGYRYWGIKTDSILSGRVNVDLVGKTIQTNGTVSGEYIKEHDNGIIEVGYTSVAQSGTDYFIECYNAMGGSTSSWAGDGTSGMYLHGLIIEDGSTHTSYIASENVLVTRNADVLTTATLPSGCSTVTFYYDDGSTQNFSVTGGATYEAVPASMNRRHLKRITNAS